MRRLKLAALAPFCLLAACGPTSQSQPTVTLDPASMAAQDEQAEIAALQAAPAIDPARLKGLSPAQLAAVLGRPGFKRRDTPAEIWQYRTSLCTLDVFLYDEAGGHQQVAHVAVRSTNPMDETACIGEVTARSKGIPSS